MYKEFYGFEDFPFNLTPDPRFLVFTPSYNETLAALYYGLENSKGLIVLTGEVGTGKTTALRWILRSLDPSVLAAYIFNPRLSVEDFYQHVAERFNLKGWETKSELLTVLGKTLEERYVRGLKTVLIIDEAHELSDFVLEEIRLLLNFESDSAKHLQIVLTGQPELRDVFNKPNLRQLKQRVALRCQILSLSNAEETERYITERLLLAGAKRLNIFTPEAIDFIFLCSGGIPRQINNLCDNALVAGYAAGEQFIGREIIEEVADNLDLLPRRLIFEEETELPNVSILTDNGQNELLSANKSSSRSHLTGEVSINQLNHSNADSLFNHSATDSLSNTGSNSDRRKHRK